MEGNMPAHTDALFLESHIFVYLNSPSLPQATEQLMSNATLSRCRLVLCAIASFFMLSCSSDRVTASGPERGARFTHEPTGQYSAQELFLGIMLGEGPVAELIPVIREDYWIEIRDLNNVSRDQIRAFNAELLDKVQIVDPSFLAGFKVAMQSGDPLTISEKLDAASYILNDAVKLMTEGDTLAYLADNQEVVDTRLAPYLDANGYLDLQDTLVTPDQANAELWAARTTGYSGSGGTGCPTCVVEPLRARPSKPNGRPGLEDPGDPSAMVVYGAVHGVIAYLAFGVHVMVVYNVHAAMTANVFIALNKPDWIPTIGGGGSRKKRRQELEASIADRIK